VERAHYDRLRSVREGRVLVVDEFLYSRPGPRCVDAVEDLASRLYPDRFKVR
jgi:iron complex transport system substrate-binding protein